MKESEKRLVKTKRYFIKVNEYSDGSVSMTRLNVGFNGFELLGIVSLVKNHLLAVANNEIKLDTIKLNDNIYKKC